MRLLKLNGKAHFYWTIQLILIGPLILLWGGVAYWFGFSSGVILKMVFPPMSVPLILLVFPLTALIWTVLHIMRTPPEKHLVRGADILLCIFIAFSMFIVAGQIVSQ
jgi:hypothetical protein